VNTSWDDTRDDLPAERFDEVGADGSPRAKTVRSEVRRDRRVRNLVLERAMGRCERAGCLEARPYLGFLDVHHILGVERSDRVWNCVALCPNCHRDAHFAPNAEQINADLLSYAIAVSASPANALIS
jgi:5-methylcytosine-specific restriction protein A